MTGSRRHSRQIWGPAPTVHSTELTGAIDDLQADLQNLIEDLRRGPVASVQDEVEEYVSELRREFLRSHRRLQVLARTVDEQDDAQDGLRRELAELADRFRNVVLTRSSRVHHDGWAPTPIWDAVHRTVQRLPRMVAAPYEPQTWTAQPDDGMAKAARRGLMRAERWLRRAVGSKMPERPVELRELARYHLEGKAGSQLEGLAALFLQAEAQLAGRSRQLLEAVARAFEALVSNAEQYDFSDMIDGLRIQLEDEFSSIERDVHQILDDGVARAEAIFGEALRALKEDLPVIATFDRPSVTRRSAALAAESRRLMTVLVTRLEELRQQVAAGYVLLALHLEFLGFRSRVMQVTDDVLSELGADVRGRSKVQLERVRVAVDDVLTGLSQLRDSADAVDEAVRISVQPLEFVVEESSAVARQLLDQLAAEASVAPLLDALNREAHALTDRYVVPQARIPRAEWKLPAPVTIIEVDFAELVSGFVQREIAPELLAITNRAMKQVLPIIDTFQDLERVVTFNAEAIDDQIDYTAASAPAGEQLTDIMQATLQRARDGLAERLEEIDHWDEDLVAEIRRTVSAKLKELRRRLGEGDIGRAQAIMRRAEPGFEWRGQVDEIAGGVKRLGVNTGAWLRQVVGSARLARWRERLGLPGVDTPAPLDASAWPPPNRSAEIPVFYSRLFASQARWAGDVINVPEAEVARAKEALLSHGPGPKAVAVVGADAAGRGALVGALLRSGKSVRRIAFSHPTSVAQLRASLVDIASGVTVQLSGLSWLVAARPGGFEPLRALLDHIVKEERRIGWLLEADELVWDFAASASPLADVFATQVRLPGLSSGGLEQALFARHQLSGYDLRFEIGERRESTPAERSQVRESFFRSLYEASGGQLQVALPLWLGSIGRVVEDTSTVIVTSAPKSPLPLLRRLPEDVWQALFVGARQGWLDGPTLAFAFQMDLTAADGRLAGLARLGLFERQGRDAFVIRRHLRGAVLWELREAGWVG